MKLAMILPLFSEYPMREYLGIELVVKALQKNGYHVDRIDMNEKLVDYLLAHKSILQDMFLSEEKKAKVQASPYTIYTERYIEQILDYDSAVSLKKDGIYQNFYSSVVLGYFDSGIFPDESLSGKYEKILDTVPVIKDFLAHIGKATSDLRYDALLVSVPHAHQLFYGLMMSKTLKSFQKGIPSIFGGSTVTLTEDSELDAYVQGGFLDGYIKYSGEERLLGVLVDLEEGAGIDQSRLIEQDYVDINEQTIDYRPEYDMSSVPVLYSRGCYWGKCSYCTYTYLDAGKFTRKDLPVLLNELEQFSGKPVRVSLITESLTPGDAKRIAEGILERDIKIRWGSFIRVNRNFDPALFSLLRDSGCIYSCVGVESVNDTVLTFLNKGYARDDAYEFFRAAREAKFSFFQVNFMYGVPVADINDELDNIDFISEFRDIIGNIAFFRLEITKKSTLGQNLAAFGIDIDHENDRRAIRVDNIPFSPALNEKEFMVLGRAYGIAGEYFKTIDVRAGLHLFLKQNPKIVPFKDAVVFEFDNHYFAGSMKSYMLREISFELFSEFRAKKELELRYIMERDLVSLFELGVIGSEEIVYKRNI
jgi:Radical SAM superfamily